MLFFDVVVSENMVKIVELEKPLKVVDFRAIVDGEKFLYRIRKNKDSPPKGNYWRERGSNRAQYHAKNSGHIVKFEPVFKPSRYRKKLSAKQMKLF